MLGYCSLPNEIEMITSPSSPLPSPSPSLPHVLPAKTMLQTSTVPCPNASNTIKPIDDSELLQATNEALLPMTSSSQVQTNQVQPYEFVESQRPPSTRVDIEALPYDRGPYFLIIGLYCLLVVCSQSNVLSPESTATVIGRDSTSRHVTDTIGRILPESTPGTNRHPRLLTRYIDYRLPPDKSSPLDLLGYSESIAFDFRDATGIKTTTPTLQVHDISTAETYTTNYITDVDEANYVPTMNFYNMFAYIIQIQTFFSSFSQVVKPSSFCLPLPFHFSQGLELFSTCLFHHPFHSLVSSNYLLKTGGYW